MNLFKLLDLVAIFILVCLGFAISTRIEELDTPFLSIPRVAFETSVPTPDPNREKGKNNPHSFPLSVLDETKTGILSTKILDLGISNISKKLGDIVFFLSDPSKKTVAKIIFTIDKSNSHVSVGFENSSKINHNPLVSEETQPSTEGMPGDQVIPELQVTPEPIIQKDDSDSGQPDSVRYNGDC